MHLWVAGPTDITTTGSPVPAGATVASDPARESQAAPVAIQGVRNTRLGALHGTGHGAQPTRRVRDGHDPDDAGHRVACRRGQAEWRARP